MTVLLLANVGLRDLLYRGDLIDPARIRGEALLRDFSSVAGEITLPVLMPLVQYVLDRHQKVQVTLFATDQPMGTPAAERDRDTLYLAEIAKRVLDSRFSPRDCQASARKIRESNPHLYDDMLTFFRERLPSEEAGVREMEGCYVGMVGGTPAANTGLMLAAIERFGDRCRTLYLPKGEQRPIQMDIGSQIQSNLTKRVAAEWLRSCAFVEALPLLKEMDAPRWVTGVVQYAAARYHFDFDLASAALEDMAIPATAGNRDARERCRRLGEDLSALRKNELPALIRELHYNAQTAHRRGEYAAFLGLVFRFHEAVLRYIVEEAYPGLSTDVKRKADKERFRKELTKWSGLVDYLASQEVDGQPLDYREPTVRVLEAMVRYLWERGQIPVEQDRRGQFQSAYDRLTRLRRLSQLRNNSAIAHGFEGVSEKRILDEYDRGGGAGHPLEDMATALEALGIPLGGDPFEKAARLALEGLK